MKEGRECGYQGVGGMGDGDELFEKVHDDGALIQSMEWHVIIELQHGDQALGRGLRSSFGFL